MEILVNSTPVSRIHFFVHKQKGQSLVELALTLSILLTLLAGAFDLGSAFFDYIALRDAAQEGAVYGSIAPKNVQPIMYRVLKSSTRPIDFLADFSKINCSKESNKPGYICITFPEPVCSGHPIQVDVYYDYTVVMPVVGFFLKDQKIPLHAKVTNVILSELCP